MEVVVDYWENQRYKPLQGGWTTPFTTGVPSFSDLSYQNSCHPDQIANVNWNAGSGWEWVQDKFELDMSEEYGKVDAEGWSYATSFEKLLEDTKTKSLGNENKVMNLVRRRRWVRTRVCKSAPLREKVQKRLDWATNVHNKMDRIVEENQQTFVRIEQYNKQRISAIESILTVTDASFNELLTILNTLNVKLSMMNKFLRERGEIESNYSSKLKALSGKWMNAGATPAQYAQASGGGAEATGAPNTGFFHVVSTAHASIAERLLEFSTLLNKALPTDVENILEDVSDALTECTSERMKLKENVILRGKNAEKMLDNYCKCLRYSSQTVKRDAAVLMAELYSINAASIHLPASPAENRSTTVVAAPPGPTAAALCGVPSLEVLSKSANNMMVSENGECLNNLHQVDVWLALRIFYGELIEVDSAVLLYHAFSKQLRRKTENFAQKVALLLKGTVKVFAHEQFRVWEDSAQMLEAVGMSPNTVLVRQPMSPGQVEGAETAGSGLQSSDQVGQEEAEEEGVGEAEEEEEDEDVAVARYIDVLVRKNTYFPMMPTAESGGSRLRGRSSIRHTEHGFALCGHLRVLLVHTTDAVSSFSTSTGSGKAEIDTESFMECLAAVTFDKVMHLFRIAAEYDGEEHGGLSHDGTYHSGYEKKHLLVSVPLEAAAVGPIFIPKDGYRDAFEVYFPDSNGKIMAPVLSLGSAKPRPSEELRAATGSAVAGVAVKEGSDASGDTDSAVQKTTSPPQKGRRASFVEDFNQASKDLLRKMTESSTFNSQKEQEAVTLRPLASIVLVADSSAKVFEWMRVIAKPFADHMEEEPESPEDEHRELHIGDMADLYEGQGDYDAMCIPGGDAGSGGGSYERSPVEAASSGGVGGLSPKGGKRSSLLDADLATL